MDQLSICEYLLKRNEIQKFLKQMITCNEKWIACDNKKISWVIRASPWDASQTVAESELTPKEGDAAFRLD